LSAALKQADEVKELYVRVCGEKDSLRGDMDREHTDQLTDTVNGVRI
jgi:hypothetical protein